MYENCLIEGDFSKAGAAVLHNKDTAIQLYFSVTCTGTKLPSAVSPPLLLLYFGLD